MATADIVRGFEPACPDVLFVTVVNGEHVYKMMCKLCGGSDVIGKASLGPILGLAGSVGFRGRHEKCSKARWEERRRIAMRSRRSPTPTEYFVDSDARQDALMADETG